MSDDDQIQAMTPDEEYLDLLPASEEEYKGYEVTVFIPEAAPREVIDLVFGCVANLVSALEEDIGIIKHRKDWDMLVSGTTADHKTEATLDRALDRINDLQRTVAELNWERLNPKEINWRTMP